MGPTQFVRKLRMNWKGGIKLSHADQNRQHKMKGGSFKDYNEKTYLPLSDAQIEKHLRGEQFIGIYPLLPDNTSWFLAADFDDQGWAEACRRWAGSLRVFVYQNFRVLPLS